MFTKQDVRDAYFAHRCELMAEAEEITAEEAAASGIAVHDPDTNQLDRAATKAARRAELDRLERGRDVLGRAKLVIGACQGTAQVPLCSEQAPTILVPAGHSAARGALRQVTLVIDIEYLTPADVAARTGTAESGWRNKAAAGQIPGAIKKGKQWLIPASAIRQR